MEDMDKIWAEIGRMHERISQLEDKLHGKKGEAPSVDEWITTHGRIGEQEMAVMMECYRQYRDWMISQPGRIPVSRKTFTVHIERLGYRISKTCGLRVVHGISLLNPEKQTW